MEFLLIFLCCCVVCSASVFLCLVLCVMNDMIVRWGAHSLFLTFSCTPSPPRPLLSPSHSLFLSFPVSLSLIISLSLTLFLSHYLWIASQAQWEMFPNAFCSTKISSIFRHICLQGLPWSIKQLFPCRGKGIIYILQYTVSKDSSI